MKKHLLPIGLLSTLLISTGEQLHAQFSMVAPSSQNVQVNPSTLRAENPSNTIQAVFPNNGWANKAALPAARWGTGPVFSNNCVSNANPGYVYLISGADASFANSASVARYDVQAGTYSAMASIPQARLQISPVEVNGKIYVMGGYGGSFSPVTTNSIYDIATNTWTTGAPLPQATGDYAIGVYRDSLIYVVGGYSGTGDLNTVQIYNTFNNTWTSGTPKTGAAVAGGRMGIVGNEIVFCGGYSQTLASTQATAYLGVITPTAPGTITWTSLPNYPGGTTGRHASGVSLENDGLVYFAGGDPDGQGINTLSSCYAYNTITDVWDSGPNMPVSVSNIATLAGAVRNDSLFIVTMAGYNGSAVTTAHSWLSLRMAVVPTASADVAICSGATTQLTATNGLSYSWSPSGSLSNAAIANPVASPITTTTYTATMGRAWGCPVTDQVVVTVNALPSVTANSTAAAVCTGSPVTLTGGGATTYTWSGGVTDAVAFTPTLTDTYTVTGTDANGCSNTAMTTVTVNALPTVSASVTATTVCEGTPVTFNGGGATTYTWSGGVTDNVPFAVMTTDTYTVTGTDANGCTNTATATVNVNALPNVTASSTASAVCDGGAVTVTGGGATSYVWSGGVTDNVSFVPTITDTYTVTGTDANGCENTASVMVTVNALPVVTVALTMDTLCQSVGIITLAGESPAGGTWSGSGVSGNTFDPMTSGLGSIMIDYMFTDANGCSSSATDSIWVDLCLDVTAVASTNGVSVFPNPTSGVFTLQAATGSTVEIMNELGQTVKAFTMTSTQSEVNMNTYESGIYFVRTINGDAVNVTRVVKH